MNALMLITALAGWSYDGFSGDPVKEEPASHPVVSSEGRPQTLATAPPLTPSHNVVSPVAHLAIPRVTTPPPPLVRQTVSSFNPAVWRLADANGQVWEHTDPDWLRRWVESRNHSLGKAYAPAAQGFAPSYPASNYCTGPHCYRGR